MLNHKWLNILAPHHLSRDEICTWICWISACLWLALTKRIRQSNLDILSFGFKTSRSFLFLHVNKHKLSCWIMRDVGPFATVTPTYSQLTPQRGAGWPANDQKSMAPMYKWVQLIAVEESSSWVSPNIQATEHWANKMLSLQRHYISGWIFYSAQNKWYNTNK